ncbi:MAG TPA: helix-turn-helix domain-containing protein [Pseudomonadota bacterium]|nr:helix-turn-helix domain-containing protein [Pseudomonadota bacterium]
MPQRPKDTMRTAILRAAAGEFAEHGLAQVPLTRIAERAGTSIGNLYKYFPSKEVLFQAAVPAAVAPQLARLLRQRIEALHGVKELRTLPAGHPYHLQSGALLQFTLQHRDTLRFWLDHSEGTPLSGFPERLVARLTQLAIVYARRTYPQLALDAGRRRALQRIYRAFLGSLSAILREEQSPSALQRATSHLTEYHLAGLRAFFLAAQQQGQGQRTTKTKTKTQESAC